MKNRWTMAQCHHGIDSPGLKPYITHLLRPHSRSVACCHAQPGGFDDCLDLVSRQLAQCKLAADPSSKSTSTSTAASSRRPRRPTRPKPHRSRTSFYTRLKSLFHLSQSDPSVELWDAAYDFLRDGKQSMALVAAYEGTITLQLPAHLKLLGGMSSSFLRVPRQQRSMLMTTITEVGLRRHRSLTLSQSQSQSQGQSQSGRARGILDCSMDMIESLLPEHPSAAVAWAGLSTLTPLLLQGMFQTVESRRCATVYLVSRIPWYTHLPAEALNPSNWKDVRDYRDQRHHMRESIVALLRRVLELEMNCVLAAASTWCQAARSVAGRNDLVELLASLREADAQVASWIEACLTSSARDSLLGYLEEEVHRDC